MGKHYHQFEQAYFTIEGEGVTTANGVDQPMVPGNVTWLPPGCVHETKCPGPKKLVYVNVSSPPASDLPHGAADPLEEGERLDPSKWAWQTTLGEPKTFHIEDRFPTPRGMRRGFNIHSVPDARNFHFVYIKLDPGRKFPRHWHDFEQAYLILSGKGVTRINGVDHPMEPGWVIWLPPGCVHETFNPKANDEQLRYVNFSSPPASSFPEGDHSLEDVGNEVARVTGVREQ